MLFAVSGPGILLWSLIGILLLLITGFAIWRYTRKKSTLKTRRPLRALKSSLITYQIALGFGEVANLKTMANVLVKNRFAKNGFSLFPAIVFCNGVFFIIANALDGSSRPVHVGRYEQRLDAWQIDGRGKIRPCIDWSFDAYSSMTRYLSSLAPNVSVVKIVPYVGSVIVEAGSNEFTFVSMELLYEKVREMAGQPNANDQQVLDTVFNELSKSNLFVARTATPKRLLRSLME